VYIGEHPFSPAPFSDCSDELESVISSCESARVSYNCSPVNNLSSCTTSSMSNEWRTDSTSPQMIAPGSCDWIPPVSSVQGSTCMMTMSGGWMANQEAAPLTINTSISESSGICDQGPPMTPTVSQLLEHFNNF
jgi:hypothetical protein